MADHPLADEPIPSRSVFNGAGCGPIPNGHILNPIYDTFSSAIPNGPIPNAAYGLVSNRHAPKAVYGPIPNRPIYSPAYGPILNRPIYSPVPNSSVPLPEGLARVRIGVGCRGNFGRVECG